MQRIAAYKPIAFETATSSGRRVRITARVEPELAFDAFDPMTGEALGEVRVWDGQAARAERRRLQAEDDWSLESWVAAEIIALNDAGDFYVALNPLVGSLIDVFDCLISSTVVSEEESG